MGPFTLDAWRNASPGQRKILAEAQHVFAPEKVLCKVRAILDRLPEGAPVFWEFSLPSPVVVVEREDGAVLFQDESETVLMTVLKNTKYRARLHKWSSGVQFSAAFGAVFDADIGVQGSAQKVAQVSDMLFSLMAVPRLIETSPVSRQQRRASERATGVQMPAVKWTEVAWTVGEKVARQDGAEESGIRQPLHFSRAHWRRPAPHHKKWVLRPGHPGRWQRVKHSWKGHPDFGISLKHYCPDLDLEGASAEVVAAVQAAATREAAAAAVAQWQSQ